MVQASIACLAPPAPIHGGPGRLRPFNYPGDCQPCRIRRHGGAGSSARLNPAESALMFPMALSALRPTARQRRESGAKGCDHSGTFRPRNRTLDYVVFPQAIRRHPDLWHAGGAPPNRRDLDRAPRPGHPLVRSMSHRIAMPRQHAPAHRGTDPPGVSQTSFPSPCMEREMPKGQRVRSNDASPPAPGGAEGAGMLAGHKFNPEWVVFLSLGQGELNEPPP